MANIFDQEPIYITRDELKDSTTILAIAALDDEELNSLIYNAQIAVDAYIVCYGTPFVDTQTFIFPVMDSDGNSLLPVEITQATFYVCEQIYVNGLTPTASGWNSWIIKSERSGDRDITYSETESNNSGGVSSTDEIPRQAIMLLQNYAKRFFRTKI